MREFCCWRIETSSRVGTERKATETRGKVRDNANLRFLCGSCFKLKMMIQWVKEVMREWITNLSRSAASRKNVFTKKMYRFFVWRHNQTLMKSKTTNRSQFMRNDNIKMNIRIYEYTNIQIYEYERLRSEHTPKHGKRHKRSQFDKRSTAQELFWLGKNEIWMESERVPEMDKCGRTRQQRIMTNVHHCHKCLYAKISQIISIIDGDSFRKRERERERERERQRI